MHMSTGVPGGVESRRGAEFGNCNPRTGPAAPPGCARVSQTRRRRKKEDARDGRMAGRNHGDDLGRASLREVERQPCIHCSTVGSTVGNTVGSTVVLYHTEKLVSRSLETAFCAMAGIAQALSPCRPVALPPLLPTNRQTNHCNLAVSMYGNI